jgi:hypothetical protein
MSEKVSEGWMAEKPLHAPRFHYIVDTRSLCGRYGFYMGELVTLPAGEPKGHEDCAECYKRRQRMA